MQSALHLPPASVRCLDLRLRIYRFPDGKVLRFAQEQITTKAGGKMEVWSIPRFTLMLSLPESYFRAEDGYRIVASIPGTKQAIEVCRASSVDLILTDILK